jgi:hypothetical protein
MVVLYELLHNVDCNAATVTGVIESACMALKQACQSCGHARTFHSPKKAESGKHSYVCRLNGCKCKGYSSRKPKN